MAERKGCNASTRAADDRIRYWDMVAKRGRRPGGVLLPAALSGTSHGCCRRCCNVLSAAVHMNVHTHAYTHTHTRTRMHPTPSVSKLLPDRGPFAPSASRPLAPAGARADGGGASADDRQPDLVLQWGVAGTAMPSHPRSPAAAGRGIRQVGAVVMRTQEGNTPMWLGLSGGAGGPLLPLHAMMGVSMVSTTMPNARSRR